VTDITATGRVCGDTERVQLREEEVACREAILASRRAVVPMERLAKTPPCTSLHEQKTPAEAGVPGELVAKLRRSFRRSLDRLQFIVSVSVTPENVWYARTLM
jgi:hypothetical protein